MNRLGTSIHTVHTRFGRHALDTVSTGRAGVAAPMARSSLFDHPFNKCLGIEITVASDLSYMRMLLQLLDENQLTMLRDRCLGGFGLPTQPVASQLLHVAPVASLLTVVGDKRATCHSLKLLLKMCCQASNTASAALMLRDDHQLTMLCKPCLPAHCSPCLPS